MPKLVIIVGADYSDKWKKYIYSKTDDVSFSTLTFPAHRGMQHQSMADGMKDWKLIFLALLVECNFDAFFGEMTFVQWLMITNPHFFAADRI